MTAGGLPAPPAAGTAVTDLHAVLLGYVLGTYPEPVTGVAQWAALTLAPGTEHVVLLPLGEALPVSGGFQVPYAAGYIQHAPLAPRTETLSEADLTAAIDFYFSAAPSRPRGYPPDTPPEATNHAGEEDLVVIRSAEQLRTTTETVVVRRLRLRKYIVTEERTITVQLRREEFRIEEVPATDPGVPAPAGREGADTYLSGEDHEATMVLYAERPLISTEVVPVERIHLSKYVVTDTQVVAATLGHEVVEQVHDGG